MRKASFTANHWGVYRVEQASDGRTTLHGIDDDPNPSRFGPSALDAHHDPVRIAKPMVRRGYLEHGPSSDTKGRGQEPFVAVSWDLVEQLVTDELRRVKQMFGNTAIFAGSYGWASAGRFHHAPSQLHRFLNGFGGFTASVNTYSLAAGEVILPHVLGSLYGSLPHHTTWKTIAEHGSLVVAFGGLPVKNSEISMGGTLRHTQAEEMQRAAANGVRFVNVSPLKSDVIASLEAQWIALRPNTDVALMLGLAHTLVTFGQHDSQFLSKYCVGFDRFHDYLRGGPDGVEKSASWAGEICDVDPSTIVDLANRMARERTMISLSWSLTRQHHGEQPFWMGVTLAAMLGQLGLPGGGVGFGYCAANIVGQHRAVIPWAGLERGNNAAGTFIPVARISDLLLNTGQTFDFDGKRYTYPDIHLVYWAGGNPFHHHQDLNRLVKAWQKPDTIVVHESWWNSMARHCDIVLPATTALERTDLVAPPADGFIVVCEPVAQPFGESRNDHDIFRSLASRLGFEADFTEDRDEEAWLRHLYEVSRQRAGARGFELPSFAELREKGLHVVPSPEQLPVYLDDFRHDPAANPLSTPSGRIEIFSQTVAGFGYEDCPGHPTWLPPAEWLGDPDCNALSLHLLSNQPRNKLHSQYDHGPHSRSGKRHGREVVLINELDAAARQIRNGDFVKLSNARGACYCVAETSREIRAGVLQLSTGAWYDPDSKSGVCRHGNPNVLTLDQGASKLSQGPSAHTCLVEISRLDEPPPEVRVFCPPEIIDGA